MSFIKELENLKKRYGYGGVYKTAPRENVFARDGPDVNLLSAPVPDRQHTSQDDKYVIKSTLAQTAQTKGSDYLGNVKSNEQDIEWLTQKYDQYRKENFNAWIIRTLDKKNKPELYSVLSKNFHELITEREQYIDDQTELQKALAKLKFKAPDEWTKEDYYLIYLVYSGKIRVNHAAVSRFNEARGSSFKYGHLNPKRFRTTVEDITSSMNDIFGFVPFAMDGEVTYPHYTSFNARSRYTGGPHLKVSQIVDGRLYPAARGVARPLPDLL